MDISIINGPNLNMLGKREPAIYGGKTLEEINKEIRKKAESLNIFVEFYQSNSEGAIVSKIQSSADKQGLIINAAAYTHTSIAIRDALLSISIPFIEVHLTNIYKRDNFRRKSYLSDIALGTIAGFGDFVYELALEAMVNYLKK